MRNGLVISFFSFMSLYLIAQEVKCLETEVTTINANGKVYNTVTFEYDQNKNLIAKKTLTDFGDTPSVSRVAYYYNSLNKLAKTQNSFNDRIINSIEYTYDLLGNKLSEKETTDGLVSSINSFSDKLDEITNFNDDGSVSTKVKSVKSKNEEIKTILNINDEVISQEILSFSDKGLKVKYELIEPKSFSNKNIIYKYNDSGKLIEETHSFNDRPSLQLIHEYNGEKEVVYKALLPNGKDQFRVEYVYTDGLQTQVKNYTNGVFYTTIEKKYDSNSNLLQEITSNNKGQILTSTNYKYECD